MKPKFISGIGALIVALLIVGVILVPVMSATESNQEDTRPSGGDPVDRDAVLERSPHLFDDAGNRLSDKEISQMIEKMPKVTYLDGMNESRSKELSEGLTRLHKYRSVRVGDSLEASPQSTSLQADSGIRINEHHYQGINGYNHPGNLEVSSSGTGLHYLTSLFTAWTTGASRPFALTTIRPSAPAGTSSLISVR